MYGDNLKKDNYNNSKNTLHECKPPPFFWNLCTTTNVDELCHFNSGLFYFTENKFCIILQPQTQK